MDNEMNNGGVLDVGGESKVEKVTLQEINQELESQEKDKTDELVKRIMNQILKID